MSKTWRIEYRGHTFTEDDLLTADVVAIEQMTGTAWPIDPGVSCTALASTISVYVARVSNEPIDVVGQVVGREKASDLLACYHVMEVASDGSVRTAGMDSFA